MRVAVVLAAGASRRMGRPKLELELGGQTLVERSVRGLVEASVDRVRVVVPPHTRVEALTNLANVEIVANPDRDRGLSSSLKVGLHRLPKSTRVVLIALADKPLVKPETIRKLLLVFDEGGANVVYPVYHGEQGHPVLFAPALVGELVAVDGDRGAKSVLDAHQERARAVEVDDPGVCLDIDTPDDYAAARETM